tara:strand:+ start:221 stop:370 length:150 start_codon:yes stop_codon:yes gene_type:complete
MPQGKGTYGKKRGRPAKKKTAMSNGKAKKNSMKKKPAKSNNKKMASRRY